MSRAPSRCSTARPFSSRVPDTVLCAIATEGRTQQTTNVGMCFIKLHTNQCTLVSIDDSPLFVRTLHKLDVFSPTQLFLPAGMMDPKSKLVLLIEECFPELKLSAVPRAKFDDCAGIELIEKLAVHRDQLDSIKFELCNKYHTACSAAVCLTQAREKCSDLRVVRFKIETSEACMMIDSRTIRSLELVENKYQKSGLSLLKVLNKTVTPMGLRLLRSNVLQPLTSVETLNSRLDAVDELMRKAEMTSRANKYLKEFNDFDRLLTAVLVHHQGAEQKQKINLILLLKQSINAAIQLYDSLQDVECGLLKSLREALDPSGSILITAMQLINSVINQDCQWACTPLELQTQQAYAVLSGTNGLLDAAREVYKQVTDRALEMIEQLGVEHGLRVESRYETKRGFIIRVYDIPTPNSLPPCFIHKVKLNNKQKSVIECTTLDLMKLSSRVKSALSEIMLISDEQVTALIDNLASIAAADLFAVGEAAAMLDMCQCLAKLACHNSGGYVRPLFGQSTAIRSGRHPVMDRQAPSTTVPNDTFINKDEKTLTRRACLVTGVNMSGKSVYLNQVALLTVMAHIGSFVPAEYAQFSITHSLHARICHDTVYDSNTSSFSREMTEVAHYLNLATPDSLVIIDELGRGSSHTDGQAIAMAVLEHFISKKVPLLAATHFHELATVLAKNMIGVCVITMKVDINLNSMKMYYKTDDSSAGMTTANANYGIKFASSLPFPTAFITQATQIAASLDDENKPAGGESLGNEKAKLMLDLRDALHSMAQADLPHDQLASLLYQLQHRFVKSLEKYEKYQ